jgi:hypothetical protein
LRLEMPEKWGSVPDLKPHIASLVPPIDEAAERSEDREAGEAPEGEAPEGEGQEAPDGEAGEAERSEEGEGQEPGEPGEGRERVRCVTLVRATANEASLAASVL